jgi:hypothetical protein
MSNRTSLSSHVSDILLRKIRRSVWIWSIDFNLFAWQLTIKTSPHLFQINTIIYTKYLQKVKLVLINRHKLCEFFGFGFGNVGVLQRVQIQPEEIWGFVTVHVVPPVASEFRLVENCTVGTQKGGSLLTLATVVADVIGLIREKIAYRVKIK